MSTLRFNTWQDTGGTEVANSTLGTGKILQVVRVTDTVDRATTSTSFVDASLSISITPTSSSSDILLMCVAFCDTRRSSSGNNLSVLQITDSSNVAIDGAEKMQFGETAGLVSQFSVTVCGFDSPATTSATTYKLRFKANTAGTTAQIFGAQNTTQLYALEISA